MRAYDIKTAEQFGILERCKAFETDLLDQQAHDLTILYMQAHTDQWKQNGELDKIVAMYKSIHAEILERLNRR